ncbi:Tuftelin-interacting protein 11 [Mycena venus]|uniref:Tuftelin-interacting protein 11 n=1 Tax=Mycena venus TaxID=2733690 RepID=A0A8H7D2G8_9AGAR|nr:Tuftelin-interacting protein 11 [Mycena venus]
MDVDDAQGAGEDGWSEDVVEDGPSNATARFRLQVSDEPIFGASKGEIDSLPSSFGNRSKPSFVRDNSSLTRPATPLSASDQAHFNRIQGTVGTRLLAKMGWQPGTGLGAAGEHIVTPVQTKLRPQKMAEAPGVSRARRKAEEPGEKQSDVWKRPKKVKTKVEHKTYEQILAEAGRVYGFLTMFTAQGGSFTGGRVPEFLVAFERPDAHPLTKALDERRKWILHEAARLRKKWKKKQIIAGLQQVQLVANEIDSKSKGLASMYEISLEAFSPLFYKLVDQFWREFERYRLDEIVVAAIAPLVRYPRKFSLTRTNGTPRYAVWSLHGTLWMLRWVSFPPSEAGAALSESIAAGEKSAQTQVDVYGSKTVSVASLDIETPMTPFESLLWNVWLPKTPHPAVKPYEAWSSFLPSSIRDNLLDQLLLPKIKEVVVDWTPRRATVSLQSIVFPWLPHLGLRMEHVLGDAQRKVKSLLRSWSVSDDMPEDLATWHEVFDTAEWNAMLLKDVVPKLGACLREEFRINPREQIMTTLTNVLKWAGHYPPLHLLPDSRNRILPQMARLSFEEVAQWYLFWKGSFPQKVQNMAGVTLGFTRALQLMKKAIEPGPDASTRLPRPDFRAEQASASAPNTPERKGPRARRPEIAFRSIVEEFAASYNLLFIPTGRAYEISRMPLFKVGLAADGKGGILVYILDDAVWVAVGADGTYRAISLEDMVLLVRAIVQEYFISQSVQKLVIARAARLLSTTMLSVKPEPIDVDNPEAIDVDAFEDVKRPLRPVKTPLSPTPIVISDDEAEITEVATKLSRNTPTRSVSLHSNVEIAGNKRPLTNVVDLVSDEEIESKSIPPLSKGKQAASRAGSTSMKQPMPAASTSRATSSVTVRSVKSHLNDPGSSRRGKGPQIYGGPPSTIRQDTRVKPKKERPTPKIELEDSEGEYENSNILLNPFEHPPVNNSHLEAPTAPTQQLVDPRSTKKRRYVDISSGPLPYISMPSSSSEYYIWDFLREFKLVPHFPPRPRFFSKRPRLDEALDMDHYVKAHKFRRAGGSINGILQHDGRVIICSSTAGGNNTAETDPYNKPGTLISCATHLGYFALSKVIPHPAYIFFPDLDIIAYDPLNNILASSWADEYVRTWEFDPDDEVEPYSLRSSNKYVVRSRIASPHDLAFKPGASILAVGEQWVLPAAGTVESQSGSSRRLTIEDLSEDNGRGHSFDLVDRKNLDANVTGAIAWGSGLSSSLILALSEPAHPDTHHDGFHHAFDTEALRSAFKFDAPEAGDALCINPTGDTAALVTNDGVESYLRIYDIRNKNNMASQTIRLEPFASESHEVNSITFSPDSMYLALGRWVHLIILCSSCQEQALYSGDCSSEEFLYNFKHSDMRFSSQNQNFFGVVGVKWVQSRDARRLGLVTGGNDGCIRLWDPLRGSQESTILAQADSDIAHFTLGDRFNGEHELVVGDSDGAIYIMDGFVDM